MWRTDRRDTYNLRCLFSKNFKKFTKSLSVTSTLFVKKTYFSIAPPPLIGEKFSKKKRKLVGGKFNRIRISGESVTYICVRVVLFIQWKMEISSGLFSIYPSIRPSTHAHLLGLLVWFWGDRRKRRSVFVLKRVWIQFLHFR